MAIINGQLPVVIKTELESSYVSGNGVQFHYVAAGQGEPVVLLHGFPESWFSWHKQFDDLAVHMRLFAFDLKGYGDSDKPAASYHLAPLTKELGEAIHALNVGPVTLVGHDWGGILAYIIAVRYPQLVSKLILMNTATRPINPLRIWYAFAMQIPRLPEAYLDKYGDELIRSTYELPLTKNPDAFSEDEIAFHQAQFRKPGVHVCSLAYYRNLFQSQPFLAAARRKGLKMPVNLIWGNDAPILTVELAQTMARELPATLHLVEDAGHFVQSEQPEKVNRLLLHEIMNR